MFNIVSNDTTFKSFKASEVVSFIKSNKISTAKFYYNYQENSAEDFLKIILKINGNYQEHIELHRIVFGDFTLKKYINDKLLQKF